MIVNRHQTFSMNPIELYKKYDLVTCIGCGYYAGSTLILYINFFR